MIREREKRTMEGLSNDVGLLHLSQGSPPWPGIGPVRGDQGTRTSPGEGGQGQGGEGEEGGT